MKVPSIIGPIKISEWPTVKAFLAKKGFENFPSSIIHDNFYLVNESQYWYVAIDLTDTETPVAVEVMMKVRKKKTEQL